jgi:hypothetical protein
MVGGWPYVGDVSDPVFGPDGTVYLLAAASDAQSEDQQSLVALDAAGLVKPGWPIEEPPGSDFGSLAVGPDGSVYVVECGAPNIGSVLHRLGTDGQELPGWPFEVPPSSACPAGDPLVSHLIIGSDGTAYLRTWHATRDQQQLFAIDALGKIKPGWPVALADHDGWWSDSRLGSDGTLFILTRPTGSESPARLSALAPDGRSRPGWPVSVPDIGGYLLGPHGTVVVTSWIDNVGELCDNWRRTVFTVLGPDGRTLPGWPRGSKGYASSPVVDADGTIYYVSALGSVDYVNDQGQAYARDRAGEIKAGWPVAVPGAMGGCGPASPSLAPDGSIYVLADDYVLGSEVTARSTDGRPQSGWPYLPAGQLRLPCLDIDCPGYYVPPAFGPDGTVYLVVYHPDPTGPRLEAVALDRQGHVKPGWPYRLPVDPTSVMVGPLTVSPDGRLFVRGGNVLLALDPDGRISR